VIEAKKVSKMYARGVYALHDLELSIGKGEFVFLTGPSGAGKSTLLRLLLRQEAPNSGQLIVNGRSLSKMNAAQVQAYRRTVGFVFQDFKLIPSRTVYENITFVPRVLGQPLAIQRRKAFQVLKWVGLQHRMNAFPLELSGGEQQRVAVARALINDPALVLADEPTGNLDSATGQAITRLLVEAASERGAAVVLVTHDPAVAAHAGRIVKIHSGHIATGRHAAQTGAAE
jgi:cell division transport system ATP-binding protein